MTIEKINEFKNYMANAGEESEGIEEILENEKDILELSEYLQFLKDCCKQRARTLAGEEKAKYEQKLENLTKALEIIYLFA